MHIITTPPEMLAWSRTSIAGGESIGFVPTMGALHDGHAHLIQRARTECTRTVVSIFVNSLQFNVASDFEKYPRTWEDDRKRCEALGVDAIYAPSANDMYPQGFDTRVVPGAVAELLEGAGRPGHFTGVATVVTKLFNAVQPTRAYFGNKDFQQLAVINRMVRDLDMPMEVVAVPTVREVDGLAMSSRNVRLSADDRRAAPVVYVALSTAVRRYESGERGALSLIESATGILAAEPRARIEYVDVVDNETCEPVRTISRPATIVAAVWFGDVRLIDNVQLQ